MPLFAEIPSAQPSFQNIPGTFRAQIPFHVKSSSASFTCGSEKGLFSAWKSLNVQKNVSFNAALLEKTMRGILIRAVATLEPKCQKQNDCGQMGHDFSENGQTGCIHSQSDADTCSSNDQYCDSVGYLTELDERERLRRQRISNANKGNTPWNKGRKHSAETLQRIKERTRLAMQDPKVKMKLVKFGHAQSEETRAKIGIGVRMGWQRRREKKMLQETCVFEWQNLIAETSRRGCAGEEELQWDSYRILDGALKEEWLESVEQRKRAPRPSGSRRAPKSAEQRRKISEAISAKWADPEYRERVCSALAKYHGTPADAVRRPRRKPSSVTGSAKRSPQKKKLSDANSFSVVKTKAQSQQAKLRASKAPRFKDPLVSSKLEMIKNIRAQRATAETQKSEAIERARLLIAEAEKAAKTLEAAAMKSPIARASLMETRRLIAEAIESIESIESGLMTSPQNGNYSAVGSDELVSMIEKEPFPGTVVDQNEADHVEVNGSHSLASSEDEDFGFGRLNLQGLLSTAEDLPSSSNGFTVSHFTFASLTKPWVSASQQQEDTHNGQEESENMQRVNGTKYQPLEEGNDTKPVSVTVTKKWVRGRLIEVAEGS